MIPTLTHMECLFLWVLSSGKKMRGAEMRAAFDSKGYAVDQSYFFKVTKRLENSGYVTSKLEQDKEADIQRNHRVFRILPAGTAALKRSVAFYKDME